MANKYIRHGATYCGDGTTPNLAASDGAPGAWNNINILEGTTPPYGTLAAGDVVYIRSKDESGAAITRTMAANVTIGSTAATAAAPITWIIDNNGEVWSGVTGVMTYNLTTNQYSVTVANYNNLFAQAFEGFVVVNPNTSGSDAVRLSFGGSSKNVMYDLTAKNNSSYNYTTPVLFIRGTHENFHYKTYIQGSGAGYGALQINTTHERVVLVNPTITLLNPRIGGACCFQLTGNSYGGYFDIIGGKVTGSGATTGQALISDTGYSSSSSFSMLRSVGLSYPRTLNIFNPGYEPTGQHVSIDLIGMDNGLGAHYERAWGYVTSRSDNYPPVLSATLPTSSPQLWAWRLYPRNPSPQYPATLDFTQFSQGAGGTKTITLELLAESTLSVDKSNVWMVVSYTDSSGTPRTETTKATGALDSSTANWSSTTWGISTFNKYKLSLTTQDAVKQDTAIFVKFFTTAKASNSLQVFFINPEFSVA